MMHKPLKFYDRTYRITYLLSIGVKRPQYCEAFNKIAGKYLGQLAVHEFEHASGRCSLFFEDGVFPHIWIWTLEKNDHIDLCHEVFHAVHKTMAIRGITLSDDSEEAYAYQFGRILEFIKFKK